MAEKKKHRGRPAKEVPDDAELVQVQIRMTPELRDAIERFRGSQEFTPQLNDVGIRAFQDFLEKKGYWPPKSQ